MINKIKEIKEQISTFLELNDIHKFSLILDAADSFIKAFPSGVKNNDELKLGIDLIRQLADLSYIGSLREYEFNFDLQNEILHKKIKVFKLCIPESHKELRGLTELIMGMKENAAN